MGDYNNETDYSKYRVEGYPVRHKKKVPFQPVLRLSSHYRSILGDIRRMDSVLDDIILGEEDYLDLVNDAYSSNIHWSVKIEGNDLPMEDIKRITALFTGGNSDTEIRRGPEQEIYNHLHTFVDKDGFKLPWSVETACTVHRILTEGTGTDASPGQIRTQQAAIYGPDGFEYFIACPPGSIMQEMESLMEWLESSPYDEVCTATLFFHEFESIHPFTDGNGRTGRTLFQILLQELGLRNAKLCKFEQELLKDTETYYSLLAYTDKTAEYGPLVMYVAESLQRAYRDAASSFIDRDRLRDADEITKILAKKSKTAGDFTVADACRWVPSVQDQVLRPRLGKLVAMGILEKEGNTRSRVYRFNDPFRNIRK